jgi:probable HAF family extracellular repeat protein
MGQVAGGSTDYSLGELAFLWTPDPPISQTGAMVELGTAPNELESNGALGINDFGQVVGIELGAGMGSKGFLWTPKTPNGPLGVMSDIGYLPGGDGSTIAYGINSLGQVVGDSTVGVIPGQSSQQHHAFVWTPHNANGTTGEIVDLNDVLDPVSGAGWVVEFAHDINDRGQIVGIGSYDANGAPLPRPVTRAFLLTPIVPEPITLSLLTLGFVLAMLAPIFRYRM